MSYCQRVQERRCEKRRQSGSLHACLSSPSSLHARLRENRSHTQVDAHVCRCKCCTCTCTCIYGQYVYGLFIHIQCTCSWHGILYIIHAHVPVHAHVHIFLLPMMEPLYKGHTRTMKTVLFTELSFIQRLNYTCKY